MKEININIEGYNVNGICVGCLNYNRKMFYCNEVKECFKLIGNIDVPDGLAIQVCWECLAAVRSVMRFQARILQSYEVLIKYSNEHTFLNSPEDFTEHASTRLTTSQAEVYSMLKNEDEDEPEMIEVKLEDEQKFEPFENPSLKEEKEYSQEDFSEDLPSQEADASSEDDIQLSKLKRKKEKRDKKSKKERKKKEKPNPEVQLKASRKLKNLPADLVELYSMSEAEMWSVRAADVASADFTSLRYKCTDCILGFNTEKLMADHLNGKHRVKGDVCHQCNICKAYFLTKDNLSVHRSLHLTAYRCKQCGAKTSLKRLMMKHVSTHRREADEFKCVTCGSEFSTKSKLTYHRGVCHQEKPQCDCCGKVFANKMTLKYHLKILPQNKDDKPKEKLHIPCKGCNKVFHSKKSYRAHVVIHEGLTYPCPTCGKLFQWKRNLARHARNHREREAGALHECKECGKTFASRDCYANHLRLSKRHAAEDSYAHECNYCGKKFPTKWCMVDHIDWDHLKRIKYQCSVCFKPFKTAKIMVAHVSNIHEGRKREQEGEHLCEICGKSYKTVKRLKGHVWAMHTKRSTTKSFKCKLCPATFTWQTSIYKHVKIMHDSGKRKQQARPPVKKEEPYPVRLELANVQYFQQNIASNLMQNIVQSVHVQHAGVGHDLVVIHEGLTYPCPTCGKLFQWKRNLARHARNHREREAGALHECKECGKTFASRDCYANHLRLSKRHAAEDSYAHECNYCGKKFPTKWCMVDHIDWDHLKRIKYQCSVCFKPFKTAKIMVAHVSNIHEGRKREQEGEHLCEICGKSYKTVKRLKGHVWAMHTKRSTTKSFKCKLCPATFTWQTSIYKHVKIMHDSGKRKQQARPPVKKEEPYPVRLELANVQYFQQNIASNLMQNIVQSVHVQHAGVGHDLV